MSYVSEVNSDFPAAWYRCQEASGYLQDSSGHALHADEVHGSPTFGASGPITSEGSDTAVVVNGATPDWWNVPYNVDFDVGDVMTVECWLKRSHTGIGEEIVVTRDQGIYLGLINDRLFAARSGVAGIAQSTSQILDTAWHHCVITKSGVTTKQYIDGVDVTGVVTNSTYANGSTPTVKIGADGGSTPFYGSLDEVAIYPTALSAARVSAHYTAATAGVGGGGSTGKSNMLLTGVG